MTLATTFLAAALVVPSMPPLQRRQERQILARKGRYPVDFSIFQFTLARGDGYLV